LKHLDRHAKWLGTAVAILIGIAAVAVCSAQVIRAASGQAWSPALALAAGVIPAVLLLGSLRNRLFADPSPAAGAPRRPIVRVVLVIFDFVVCTIWFAAASVCGVAAFNRWGGASEPLSDGAIRGAIFGAGTLAIMLAERRGWLRGIFFAPDENRRARSEQLARQREDILARARQN
jgi:hypothetical protein